MTDTDWAAEVAARADAARAADLLIALERIKNMILAELLVIDTALAALPGLDDGPSDERLLNRTLVSSLRDQKDILQRLLTVAAETDLHDPPLA